MFSALIDVYAKCPVSYPPLIARALVRTRSVCTGPEFRTRIVSGAFVYVCAFRPICCAIVACAAQAIVRSWSVFANGIRVASVETFGAFVNVITLIR